MVEAVIVLPFFILIFAGILYMTRLYQAKQSAWTQARGRAWISSARACEDEPTVRNPSDPRKQRVDGMVRRVGEQPEGATNSSGERGRQAGQGPDRMQRRTQQILSKQVEGLFGESVTISASRSVQRPGVLGMKTVTVTGGYHLVCNLKPMTLGDVAGEVWDMLWD